ncbi:MAG: hypothetical protein ABJD07_00570 [Gemmatimonadaceae bacterium]
MTRPPARAIRIVLGALNDNQRSLVEACLERANRIGEAGGVKVFEIVTVEGRGIRILEQAANADVVLLGLEHELLPGEASHIVASYPNVKVIGLDDRAHVRTVLGAVNEPLSTDLPTVIRWITRRSASRTQLPSRPVEHRGPQ